MTALTKVLSNKPGKSTTYMGDDGQTYTLSGDLAQRANNPGNISPVSKAARANYEKNYNVIGYIKSSDGPAVAVFATPEDGARAQAALWASPRYQNMTLAEAATHWAASPYVAQLGAAAGVDPNTTKVSDLTPQQMSAITTTQTGIEGNRRLTITGGANNTTIDRATFFGPNSTQTADAQLALMGNTGQRQPQSAALTAANQVAGAEPKTVTAPQPMPGRPAAITGPQAAAPATNSGSFVTLPSGQQIATGTFPSSNPGHTVTVTDDGTGKAVITHNQNPGEIPGVIDPLHEPAGTVAGGIVQRTIQDIAAQKAKEAAAATSSAVSAAAPGVQQGAQGAINGATAAVSAAPAAAMNYLSGLFGGNGKAAPGSAPAKAPTNVFASGSAGNHQTAGSGASLTGPSYDNTGAPISYADLAKFANLGPTTTYSTQQMVKDNPNYLSYVAAQKADPIGAGPGSFGSLQNALATTQAAPPPRTITTSQQVAHTAADPQVLAAQQQLAKAGYYTGNLDGLYGPKTAAAVSAAKAAAPVNALAPAPVVHQAAPAPAPAGIPGFDRDTGTWSANNDINQHQGGGSGWGSH